MAEATQPDKIVPQEKRSHHAGARPAQRGRPRKANSAPRPDDPGIVQAPQVVKSELDMLTEGLATLYGTVGTLVMFGNEYDGMVIIQNAENMSRSVVAACQPYPSAWRVLKLVVQGNVWSVLLLAHLGPTLAIMANHGMINKKAAQAFRQAPIPEQAPPSTQGEATGPYSYPGTPTGEGEMNAQQQQELAQYIAAMAIQQGQQTAQQQAAQYGPPPIDYGNAGDNGAVGMDSVSGLGDQTTAATRALFTAAQIDKIREESLRKSQEIAQNGQTSGL